MKEPTSTKTAGMDPAALLEMSPPWEIPKYTQNRMTILRKTLEWVLPNIPFTILNVKILFTKFAHIYR